ncbi:MAG TPA: hypothetical protein VFU36_09140 [Jatrophihabitans sp.]|nr:hypothetical protein [Jatrophihabitans sp.]
MSTRLRQQVGKVRLTGQAGAEASDVGVLVETPWPATPVRLLPGQFDLDRLTELADRELLAMTNRLPGVLLPYLVIETGAVEQAVHRDDEVLASRTVHYIISSCRGMVLSHGVPSKGYDLSLRLWTGTVEPGGLPDGLPAVLAPAALLALVLHLDGNARAAETAERWTGIGPVLSRDTASPYPPHTSPLDLLAGRRQPAGLPPDSCRLRALFRPELWSRPAGSLVEDTLASVLVSCGMSSEVPERAVVIEELVPVSSSVASGRWLARVALCAGADRLASLTDLVLRLDPERVLATCRGALSGVQVAVVSSPFAEDRYGFAPWVLLAERLQALAG